MKNKVSLAVLTFAFLVVSSGIAYAATTWSGDNEFTGTVNWFKKGIKIGEQGSGGVTFFNGTIVNQTTTDSVDNPVAFGDNVRIDGEIWRGETSGPGDDMPVKINDDLRLFGDLTVDGSNPASGVDYDNSVSGLSATNVQSALDEAYGYFTTVYKGSGDHVLLAGASTVQENNSVVTATSKILLTIGGTGVGAAANTNGGLRIVSQSGGVGFVVGTMDGNPASADIPFSYLVLY